MKPNQTLNEARKYLLYVSDALHAVAQSHLVDREARSILDKYAADIFEYSNGLEKLGNHITAKEQTQKKLQVVAELQDIYEARKRNTIKARENLRIVKARLKQAEETGIEKDIEEAKQRVAYYSKQNIIAQQNELTAKREFEQGA